MTTLFRHQEKALTHLIRWRVGALFMEAGTGKTRVALEIIKTLPHLDFVLWVGPLGTLRSSQKESVPEELSRWGGIPVEHRFVGVESISASDRIYLETRALVERATCALVIVDESIKIKNAAAKRTKRLLDIGSLAHYRFILNGTPLSRNLLDLWAQMEFLSPDILKMSETRFKNTFCKYTTARKFVGNKRTPIVREFITGYENIDYLYSLIRHYVYECDLQLNVSQLYNSCNYQLSDEEKEEYNRIKEKYLNNEMLQAKNNNIFLELTSKMQHAYCCSDSKIAAAREIITDEERTIIFCRFIRSRERCEREFPKARVLSYQKESLGLNLQDYHTTIYFDKVWDYALRVQSGRRTYRVGQTCDCRYYDLTGNVGLEEMMDKCIRKKISMVEYFKQTAIEQIKNEL